VGGGSQWDKARLLRGGIRVVMEELPLDLQRLGWNFRGWEGILPSQKAWKGGDSATHPPASGGGENEAGFLIYLTGQSKCYPMFDGGVVESGKEGKRRGKRMGGKKKDFDQQSSKSQLICD